MSARRALLLSYLDRFASLGIGFVASVLIARLLTPAEVGVFSVAMLLVGFLGPFRDVGATQFVVRSPVLDEQTLVAVRSLQLVMGLALASVIAGSSFWVAAFYQDTRIRDVMLLLALNSLALPFGALSLAMLNRELRIGRLAAARLSGATTGATTSVLLAWKGLGPIALAVGALTGTLVTAIVAVSLRPVLLGLRLGLAGSRQLIQFGGAMTGTALLGMLYQSVAELSLARLQSLSVSGLFGRAQGFVNMLEHVLLEGAYSIGASLFSAALREGRPIAPIYLRAVAILCALGWSLFGLTATLAEPLILMLYGPRWAAAAPIAQALCIVLMLLTPNLLLNALLIALGKAPLILKLAALSVTLQVLLVASAAAHSLHAACIAAIVVAAIVSPVFTEVTRRQLGIGWPALARTLLHGALVAVCALVAPVIIRLTVAGPADLGLWQIPLASVGALLGGMAAARLSHHPIHDEIWRLVARVRSSPASNAPGTPS